MTVRLSICLLVGLAACASDHEPRSPGGAPGGGHPGGGAPPPPLPVRGMHDISDVQLEPGGERAWLFHSSIADENATPAVTTAHLGVYLAATGGFIDALDATGTQGKSILFPARGTVLYVAQRSADRDVFVTIDAVTRRPLAQRSHPGDRASFRMSPAGRAVLSTDGSDGMLHVLDTASLLDQPVPGVPDPDKVAWAPTDDVFYVLQADGDGTLLQRYDLRDADLTQPVPAPVLVTRLASRPVGELVLSLDGRFAALRLAETDDTIALIVLATGKVTRVAGSLTPVFTNDHRALIWQHTSPVSPYALRIVDPQTGAVSATLDQGVRFPSLVALRQRDAIIEGTVEVDAKASLIGLSDGTRTELPGSPLFLPLIERIGHPEVWMWDDFGYRLWRLDLMTGAETSVGFPAIGYAPRPEADDVLIKTIDLDLLEITIRRVSLATAKDLIDPAVIPNPNDLPASYRLAAE